MRSFFRYLTPILLIFTALTLVEAGITADFADARARIGGRSFKRSMPRKTAPASKQMNQSKKTGKSSFGRGLMGGLIGGALGGLLFGSLFGMHGSGMGILPILLLFGAGYFFYKRFFNRPAGQSSPGYQPPPAKENVFPLRGNVDAPSASDSSSSGSVVDAPVEQTVESGLAEIRRTDRSFDDNHFTEVASDVFFKVQAGWMRRDISTFRHLLGNTLASEYEKQFAQMQEQGHINKLESIAIRKVEIVDAGSEGNEDFVTVLFTANLLDYTVDDKTEKVIEGSMTEPVKFAERWTWARATGTNDWKLEGIDDIA